MERLWWKPERLWRWVVVFFIFCLAMITFQVGCSVEDAGHPPPKVELHLNRSSDLVPLESGLKLFSISQLLKRVDQSSSVFGIDR